MIYFRLFFSIFFNMKIYCSHKNILIEAILMSTHNIPFQYKKKKITLNHNQSEAIGFCQGTQERVRNRSCKRSICVRSIEVLLYYKKSSNQIHHRFDPRFCLLPVTIH